MTIIEKRRLSDLLQSGIRSCLSRPEVRAIELMLQEAAAPWDVWFDADYHGETFVVLTSHDDQRPTFLIGRSDTLTTLHSIIDEQMMFEGAFSSIAPCVLRIFELGGNEAWARSSAYALCEANALSIQVPSAPAETAVAGNDNDRDLSGFSQAPTAAAKAVGSNLHSLRADAGLSVEDLAARSGIDSRRLIAIEDGSERPSADEILELAKALAVPLPRLFVGL